MFTLLSPAALWSLAALALPLALHLWRQPPRTIRLPSLRFLQAHAGRRLSDLRWRERLLLLARLALLATLACLLARPRWQRPPPSGPQRWMLVDPTAALSASSLARYRALQGDGYRTHLLAPGLPAVAQLPTDPAAVAPDLWSRLREADAMLPAGSALAVFSPTRLTSLQGTRPALRAKTEWIKTPDIAGDGSRVWLDSLFPADDPVKGFLARIGVSDVSTTRFQPSPPAGWKLETHADAARLVSPDGKTDSWVTSLSSSPLTVRILHDAARAEDARYLAAGVRTAAASSHQRLDLRVVSLPLASQPPAADWTFWLAASVPPPQIANLHTRLFEDSPQPDAAASDWLVPEPGTPGAAALASSVRLWRRGASVQGIPFWTDASGEEFLTFAESAAGPRWHFASRFHPDWTDLPRTSAFPAWLQSLLCGDPQVSARHDLRLADVTQAQSSPSAPTTSPPMLPLARVDAHDLHWLVWALAAFLFCLERLLSHRRQTIRASSPTFQPEPVTA